MPKYIASVEVTQVRMAYVTVDYPEDYPGSVDDFIRKEVAPNIDLPQAPVVAEETTVINLKPTTPMKEEKDEA
jgi:hypothetical protein